MKILAKLFYTFFILILLSVAGLFLASLLPIPGNIEAKIVKSGSMEPAIKTGSVVIVKPADSYGIGDIITFGEDTRAHVPTTHRIIEILGSGSGLTYTVKGDANEDPDPTQVPARSVIGKVVFSIPYAGFVLDFARQPIGFTFLIAIPAAIIILDESMRIIQEIIAHRKRRKVSEQFRFSDIRPL